MVIIGFWKAKGESFGGRKRLALSERAERNHMSGYGVAYGNLIPSKKPDEGERRMIK